MSNIRSYAGEAAQPGGTASRGESKRSNSWIRPLAGRGSGYDQGISDFQNQQTGYQAALQTYASVQKLSLFQLHNSVPSRAQALGPRCQPHRLRAHGPIRPRRSDSGLPPLWNRARKLAGGSFYAQQVPPCW